MFKAAFNWRLRTCDGLSDGEGQPLCQPDHGSLAQEEDNCMEPGDWSALTTIVLQFPLLSKCGYFKKALLDSSDVELPERFAGGAETFEMVALFCYNSPLPFDPFNVAVLRCAADVLEMTEDYSRSNLCERTDLYLNQVVLQSWDDTLIVLQKCQTLLPWAEELLIVSRCVESLAFMACMEILDPEHKKDWPVTTLQATLTGPSWSCELVKEMASRDLWIKDLIALPFELRHP